MIEDNYNWIFEISAPIEHLMSHKRLQYYIMHIVFVSKNNILHNGTRVLYIQFAAASKEKNIYRHLLQFKFRRTIVHMFSKPQ